MENSVFQERMSEKCDLHLVSIMESRINTLEEHIHSQERDQISCIRQLEHDISEHKNELRQKLLMLGSHHSAFVKDDHLVKDHGTSDEEMIKSVVQDEMKKKAREDAETMKRKCNIIIYRTPEKKEEDVMVRKADDKTKPLSQTSLMLFSI